MVKLTVIRFSSPLNSCLSLSESIMYGAIRIINSSKSINWSAWSANLSGNGYLKPSYRENMNLGQSLYSCWDFESDLDVSGEVSSCSVSRWRLALIISSFFFFLRLIANSSRFFKGSDGTFSATVIMICTYKRKNAGVLRVSSSGWNRSTAYLRNY